MRINPIWAENVEINSLKSLDFIWAVVVAQLVEQSFVTPEAHISNPDIDKIFLTNLYIKKIEKRKIKKKNLWMAHL